MKEWERLCPYLPGEWLERLAALPEGEQKSIQELRIRGDAPVVLSTSYGLRYLCPQGLTAVQQPGVVRCSLRQLDLCVSLLCQESVYAHQEELRQGFLSLEGGIRVGIAGCAVTGGEVVRSVRQITSLCIRMPRRHVGCGAAVLPYVVADGTLHSTLLVGEPASGKTSLLRDVAADLAARHLRVAVVDERGELAGVDGLPGCDVLRGYPKAVGIRQAIRCLAPQVVVFDELGEEEEVQAVAACAHAGVAVLASLHGNDCHTVVQQPAARLLLERQVFDRWVFLAGRQTPGRVDTCVHPEVKAHEIHWTAVDRRGRNRCGPICLPSVTSPGGGAAAAGAGVGASAPPADLHRFTYGTAVAGDGRR